MKDTTKDLVGYWKQNIQENLKTISALIFLILTKMLAIVAFGIKLGLDVTTILIIVYFAVDAYIVIWMRVIFTGEVSASQLEKDVVQQQLIFDKKNHDDQLVYEREIAEYRVTLAALKGEVPKAIVSNKDWILANNKLSPENHVKEAINTINENLPKIDPDKLPLDKD